MNSCMEEFFSFFKERLEESSRFENNIVVWSVMEAAMWNLPLFLHLFAYMPYSTLSKTNAYTALHELTTLPVGYDHL